MLFPTFIINHSSKPLPNCSMSLINTFCGVVFLSWKAIKNSSVNFTFNFVHPFKMPSSMALILLPDKSNTSKLLSAWNSTVEKIGFSESPNRLSVNRTSINVSCGGKKMWHSINNYVKLIFFLSIVAHLFIDEHVSDF